MSARRVAVTGLGVVAPAGLGQKSYWEGLLGPGLTDTTAIEIEDWDPTPYFANPKEARRADRVEAARLHRRSRVKGQCLARCPRGVSPCGS